MMTGSAINLNISSILTLEGNAGLSGTGTIALASITIILASKVQAPVQWAQVSLFTDRTARLVRRALLVARMIWSTTALSLADFLGGAISLAPTGGTTNNGILEAQNGGTLYLNSNVITLEKMAARLLLGRAQHRGTKRCNAERCHQYRWHGKFRRQPTAATTSSPASPSTAILIWLRQQVASEFTAV